jgi:hypothetical protein
MIMRVHNRSWAMMIGAAVCALAWVSPLHAATRAAIASGRGMHLPAPLHSTAPNKPNNTGAAVDVNAILSRYRTNLNGYRTPTTLSFTYTIDEVGQHQLSQTHLLYRDGAMVRDEIIAIGSSSIKPRVHIYRSKAHHYAVEAVAPRLSNYHFRYVGQREEAGRVFYHFATSPVGPKTSFTVSDIEIDGQSFLPAVIDFRARSGTVTGDGNLHYNEFDGAWLIEEASANGRTTHGGLREHLVFRDYHVLTSLPLATFGIAEP